MQKITKRATRRNTNTGTLRKATKRTTPNGMPLGGASSKPKITNNPITTSGRKSVLRPSISGRSKKRY